MTELSGTLEGVGLPAIVRFLTGLKKTGSLRIVYNDWRGEIVFDQGQVTGATLGTRRGLTALDALVQALPGGSFTFDGAAQPHVTGEATISLSAEALQAHMDDLVNQTSSGTPRLPSLDAVPAVLEQDNSSSGEEPLPLDRATLQTLLAVDGRRTVQEIVTQRGSLDALWQLANLVEVGLLRISPDVMAAPGATPSVEPAHIEPAHIEPAHIEPAHVEPERAEPEHIEPAHDEPARAEPEHVVPSAVEPGAVAPEHVEPTAVTAERVEPTLTRPFITEVAAPAETSTHCPKLGFEDDPTSSFSRPTRMHRCFAAGAPLPLSLDQQRELCLSDQFPTCPRLTMGGFVPPAREPQSAWDTTVVRRPGPGSRRPEPHADDSRPGPISRRSEPEADARRPGPVSRRLAPEADARRPGPVSRRPEPEADDSRIVRLPFVGRANAAERSAVADRQAVGGAEPTRFRSAGAAPHEAAPTPPTPLRSRLESASGPGSAGSDGVVAEPPTAPPHERPATESHSADEALVGEPAERRLGGVRVRVIAGGAVILAVLAVIVYLVSPQMGNWFADDSLDSSLLPNTKAAAAGTPIAQLTGPRAASIARATAAATGGFVAVAPDVSDPATSKVDPNSAGAANAASAASASTAAPAPALPPQPAQPAAAAAKPAAAAAGAAQPAAGPAGGAQPAGSTLLEERFTNNDRNWPSTPQGTAFVSNGSYRLAPRQAGQFVAVGAPIADALKDVVINATFHKLSGPPGGGYGIIVRDQAAAPQNGTSQDGRYYVLEVGDKGEVGMWRRDGDHWVDLLPWQTNAAVKPDTGSNDVSVRAIGNRITMTVNGTLVVAKTDDTFAAGGVGLFAGGDGNQVAVDRFSIQAP